jgi:protein phosphatase 1 regulatory subunit 7
MIVARYKRRNLREIPECQTDAEELDVSCNFLSAVPGSHLAAYQFLRRLYLSCNELTEVPNFGCVAKQLEVLHLNNNKIESIENMERMTRLKELNLRGNRITELGNLSNNTQIEWSAYLKNLINYLALQIYRLEDS